MAFYQKSSINSASILHPAPTASWPNNAEPGRIIEISDPYRWELARVCISAVGTTSGFMTLFAIYRSFKLPDGYGLDPNTPIPGAEFSAYLGPSSNAWIYTDFRFEPREYVVEPGQSIWLVLYDIKASGVLPEVAYSLMWFTKRLKH